MLLRAAKRHSASWNPRALRRVPPEGSCPLEHSPFAGHVSAGAEEGQPPGQLQALERGDAAFHPPLWVLKETLSDAPCNGVPCPSERCTRLKAEGELERQSPSPGEAYQSRHDSGHSHRILSLGQLQFTFVQQIHAGIQHVLLKLFVRESGDLFMCCSKPTFAQSLQSLLKFLEQLI